MKSAFGLANWHFGFLSTFEKKLKLPILKFVMENLSIRMAVKSDILVLTNLLYQLFSVEEDFTFNKEKHERGLSLLIDASNTAIVLVAELDGKVVGMLSAQSNISSVEGNIAITLEDMIVDKSLRGLGIGKKLMLEMLQWAEKNGITRMQLLADKTNLSALAYYNKLGWKQTNMFCLRKYTRLYHKDLDE